MQLLIWRWARKLSEAIEILFQLSLQPLAAVLLQPPTAPQPSAQLRPSLSSARFPPLALEHTQAPLTQSKDETAACTTLVSCS